MRFDWCKANLHTSCEEHKYDHCEMCNIARAYVHGYETAKEDMPKTGWIPVSERLPEKDGRYLVTCPSLGDDLEVSTAWYGTPLMPIRPVKGKCFFDSDDEWGDVPYDDVLAWMPLPKPYKGGDTE